MRKYLHLGLIFTIILTIILSGCGGGSGRGPAYTPGQQSPPYTVGGVTFYMRYVPGGSFMSDDNIISEDPNLPGPVTVANAYWVAETEVTYQLWKAVYDWATDAARGANQYQFQNKGEKGDGTDDTDLHPVTTISWRDAIVWCNALTEYYNAQNGTDLACVYTYGEATVRDSKDATACDGVTASSTAKGFRLPTSNEWELAARYQNGTDWTPGDHVSGDTSSYCHPSDAGTSTVFRDYAWYWDNCEGSVQPVGQKIANFLSLKDMSGNVVEWCFDNNDSGKRLYRGGGWGLDASFLRIGYVLSDDPDACGKNLGFRPVRTE